jgi:hypothetical protein
MGFGEDRGSLLRLCEVRAEVRTFGHSGGRRPFRDEVSQDLAFDRGTGLELELELS